MMFTVVLHMLQGLYSGAYTYVCVVQMMFTVVLHMLQGLYSGAYTYVCVCGADDVYSGAPYVARSVQWWT